MITDGAEVLVPDWLLLGVELVLSALLELVTLFEDFSLFDKSLISYFICFLIPLLSTISLFKIATGKIEFSFYRL